MNKYLECLEYIESFSDVCVVQSISNLNIVKLTIMNKKSSVTQEIKLDLFDSISKNFDIIDHEIYQLCKYTNDLYAQYLA